ncbi:DUF498 [Desulfonema limicola]|uniref:DUF498 n=2 Tax=Desulfonema limicola TaxID=45656 RepID=A0A975B4K7_9BACT|nr:DUF498 [Desulfonema limicola]
MKSPIIEAIQWGSMKLEGYPSGRDFMIYPGGAKSWDWNESNTSHEKGIQPKDIQFLIDKGAVNIVLATGMNSRLKVSDAAIEFLEKTGIEYCILSTEDAVKEYNRLASTIPVGGLFHTTC